MRAPGLGKCVAAKALILSWRVTTPRVFHYHLVSYGNGVVICKYSIRFLAYVREWFFTYK